MMCSNQVRQTLLLQLLWPIVVPAQTTEAFSIPEPTDFSVFVSSENVVETVIERGSSIAGGDSFAEVSAVKTTVNGEDDRQGVRISLRQGNRTDRIYLDARQASQLKQEILSFQSLYENGDSCTTRNVCMRGVARCRPSQTETQAVCPTYYYSADGHQGIRLSTPRQSFDFPYVEPSVFVYSIAEAFGGLTFQRHQH